MDSRPGEACQRPLGIRRAVDEEFARPGGVGDDDERHAVGQEESSIPRRPPGASPSRQRAQSTHGSARLTMDVDVVYSRRRANVERGLNFTLTTDLGPLDLLGEIPGGRTFEDLYASACGTPRRSFGPGRHARPADRDDRREGVSSMAPEAT